jgi:hypothetical protein
VREGGVAQEAIGDLRKGIKLHDSTAVGFSKTRFEEETQRTPGQALDAKPEAKRGGMGLRSCYHSTEKNVSHAHTHTEREREREREGGPHNAISSSVPSGSIVE